MNVQAVNQKTVATDQAWSIEQHAIEPIPLKDRHGSPIDLFRMWVGANVNYVVLITGVMVYAAGLSFWQAIFAVLAGNTLGCLVLGLSSLMGPKTGSTSAMTSRVAFGQLGSFIPKLASLISALSWFSINSVVATDALLDLLKIAGLNQPVMMWVALGMVLVGEIFLAIFGHATIIAAEKWIAMILSTLFAGILYFILPHIEIHQTLFGAAAKHASIGTWLVTLGVVASYPIGWTNYASDYSRYFSAKTDPKKIVLCAGGGQFFALCFCEIIGILFAIALGGQPGNDPVGQLTQFLPNWFLVPVLIAIILGGIAANVPNGYTASLGLLALRIPITRITSLGIISLFTICFRVTTMIYGDFFGVYESFLSYMIFWTAPWAAIIIVDYFMRQGQYSSSDLMAWGTGRYWYGNGLFWPGIVAFFAGIISCFVFSNSPAYVSPFMTQYFPDFGDLSFEMGMIVSALLYYTLSIKNANYRKSLMH